MVTPRWAETLVFSEEYVIYDTQSAVTCLLFKHALHEVNLEVVSSMTTPLFFVTLKLLFCTSLVSPSKLYDGFLLKP